MKQVVRKGLREIIIDEVADPCVSANHVLVRPAFSLISSGTETADIHTDSIVKEVAENPNHLRTVWNIMKKTDPLSTLAEVRAKFKEYAVLGYSGAGVIVDKDAAVADLAIGQRVAYGGEGTGHGETINVGRNLIACVPDNVSLREASFTTLGAIAMNAVRLAEIELGSTVAVIGLGLVGQLTAQLARAHGGVVIGIDLDRTRVKLAVQTAVHHGLVGSERIVDEIAALTGGRGVDRVIVAAASSSPQPLNDAVAIAADRGRVVMVGACPIEAPRAEMYRKELSFVVSRAYGPGSYDTDYEKRGVDYPIGYVRWTENRNMEEFLRLISAGQVDVKPLISHEFPLDDAPKAYQTIMNGPGSLGVVLRYDAEGIADAVAAFKPNRSIVLAPEPVRKDAVGVALIGAGNLAKWAHLPALKKLSGVNIEAVYSNNGARGRSYATRFGARYTTSDKEAIFADPNIDAVVIASRHSDHARQIVDALGAGKHVFVEKPMAITVEECQSIARAVRSSGRQLMIGFNRRFAPDYVEMKRQLTARTGPAVVSVRMNSPGIQNGWAAAPEQGGVVLGEACHFIDLMYWLLDSEPVSVSAYSADRHNISASFRFADGSVGNLIYTVIGSETSGGEMVEVFAPGIAMQSSDMKGLIVKGRSIKKSSRFFSAKGYRDQMQAFINALQHGTETGTTLRDGARATLGCLLMLESGRNGEPRQFNLDEVLANA